jgi:hypothetical protein
LFDEIDHPLWLVMRGLDPRIHQKTLNRFNGMDCQVKPCPRT